MGEFDLIDRITERLRTVSVGPQIVLGPGDDAAIVRCPTGSELVSSIDTLIAERHFPAAAPAELVGERALRVAASDLVAMGAEPGFATVALSLPEADAGWVATFADGIARAAAALALPIVGGNLARGPLTISVAVQGFVPVGRALCRSTAAIGDRVFLAAPVGGAAAALRTGALDVPVLEPLSPLLEAYFRPPVNFTWSPLLRGRASAAIDVSDGLLQDLGHVLRASQLGARLDSQLVPLVDGAGLADALGASDDYTLCFTVPEAVATADLCAAGAVCIGELVRDTGLWLDGERATPEGFNHFSDAVGERCPP
ncbi:MAG: thiamine-phosphate kinase [Pseudomonadota bacterium]